jgi:3-phenylpropionate/cinnamic acid dioxygenase small subunit
VDVQQLMDQHEIREVLYRYCRGIDRRDYDIVRACYHPDATDDHGAYSGDIDGFIKFASEALKPIAATMHFMGNVLIELDGDSARSESYVVTYHRSAKSETGPGQDFTLAGRYVDKLDKRDGRWAIGERVCVWSWARTDPLGEGAITFAGMAPTELTQVWLDVVAAQHAS